MYVTTEQAKSKTSSYISTYEINTFTDDILDSLPPHIVCTNIPLHSH